MIDMTPPPLAVRFLNRRLGQRKLTLTTTDGTFLGVLEPVWERDAEARATVRIPLHPRFVFVSLTVAALVRQMIDCSKQSWLHVYLSTSHGQVVVEEVSAEVATSVEADQGSSCLPRRARPRSLPMPLRTIERQRVLAGEELLMLAVIEQAIHDFTHAAPGIRAEAGAWIFGMGSELYPFHFGVICDHFELDRSAVRRALQKQKDAKRRRIYKRSS